MILIIAMVAFLLVTVFFIVDVSRDQEMKSDASSFLYPFSSRTIVKHNFTTSPETVWKAITNLSEYNFWFPGILRLLPAISNSQRYVQQYSFDSFHFAPGSEILVRPLSILPALKGRILSIENNWFPTGKELEKKIKSVGKNKNLILILNSPNNPSGAVCKNLIELARVAKKYKIIVLSDEIYTDLTFSNEYESISKFYPELTFITGGLSKWCGAGGWRLGFLAVPKKLTEFLKSLKSLASESYSTVNTPTQYASVEAYANEHNLYKLKVRAILKAVGFYVYNNLKSNKILIAPPQGAFYLMPEFKNKKYKTSSELCKAILNDTGVAMLPGSDFGFKPKKMLTRLSYTDFDGVEFFRNVTNCKMIDDEMIKKYAPNVVEGVFKLSNWVKNL